MPESNVSTSSSGSDNGHTGSGLGATLRFHGYRYFPYERELAQKEVRRVTGDGGTMRDRAAISLPRGTDSERARTLTYIAHVENDGRTVSTHQHELEESHRKVTGVGNRQVTRYSAHGLHEYKGRFNPQLARFLLNYLGASKNSRVLDPFCGSGTTLVECSLNGISAAGVDMNPLAVFLSNAKQRALSMRAKTIQEALRATLQHLPKLPDDASLSEPVERADYLREWFPLETFSLLERLRLAIRRKAKLAEPVLLAIASDLLRDYSLQEPADLRIRRRISEFPERPFLDAFAEKAEDFIRTLGAAQTVTGVFKTTSSAHLGDSRDLTFLGRKKPADGFDFVITSPPYATALPYIDTQRLSLVWLSLCSAGEIRELEGAAVGSRERRAGGDDWDERLRMNSDVLPPGAALFCRRLQNALTVDDGFRRRAVPKLLYRYFADMKRAFASLSASLSDEARLAFVVGANHTTLGGTRFDIDTPRFLAEIGESVGFRVSETIPLQTYQRYGLHQKNSTVEESITILER